MHPKENASIGKNWELFRHEWEPYKCTCGASYARRDLLKRHQSIAHSPITSLTTPVNGNNSETQDGESHNLNAAFIEPISWGLPGTRGTPAESIEQQGQLTDISLQVWSLVFIILMQIELTCYREFVTTWCIWSVARLWILQPQPRSHIRLGPTIRIWHLTDHS